MLELGIFILSFVLLIKGSDLFVEASSRLAKKLGVSEFLIGMTVVALGTSIPELASSVAASLKGESGLVIGGIIGSNVANIGLILGMSAFFGVIKIKKIVITRDAKLMVFAALALYLLAFNKIISRSEGILFLIIYIAYMSYLFSADKGKREKDFEGFLDYLMKFKYVATISKATLRRVFFRSDEIAKDDYLKKEGLIKDLLVIILSLIAIVYGGKYLVAESVAFAKILGVSTNIIGLTVIAVGTSLPELSVAIRAAKKGFGEMVIGNIIGSNITNILLVIGLAATINPLEIIKNTLIYTAPALIVISLLCVQLMKTQRKLSKKEGMVLIVLYAIFIISVILIK